MSSAKKIIKETTGRICTRCEQKTDMSLIEYTDQTQHYYCTSCTHQEVAPTTKAKPTKSSLWDESSHSITMMNPSTSTQTRVPKKVMYGSREG